MKMYQSSNFATIKFLFEAHANACHMTKLRASSMHLHGL